MNVPVRIQTGAKVRIDGQEFEAGPVVSGGRVFFDKSAGTQKLLSEVAQLRMARDWRLTAGELPGSISSTVAQALSIDWGSFTPAEREIALRKANYIRALDKQPTRDRAKKKVIARVIGEVGVEFSFPIESRPTPRQVRRWYRLYIAAGRDVRSLVDLHYAKGNRKDRHPDWVKEEVEFAIDECLITPTPASFRAVWRQANLRIRERAAKESENPEAFKLGGKDIIGENLVRKLFRNREQYEVLVAQVGQREADRLLASVELGPQGAEVNSEWEVDHTPLDIFVIDPDSGKAAARPWMTTILDRYSRCIVGFSLSFAPPSWASIMDALRISIRRKDRILATLGGIHNTWDCYGVPAQLICDKGRDFMSKSLEETSSALNFRIVHMKPKKPWLKGKVERWFRTLEEEIIHTLPGTTFSNIKNRKFYDSQGCAVLTIEETNWIIAKWIVDVYHQKDHAKLRRQTPAKVWNDGLRSIPPPLEFPASLLKPLMGLVIPRTIRRTGVTYLGLRWDSHGFSSLRNRMPRKNDRGRIEFEGTENVLVRIDPVDLTKAYAWDEENKKWVEGHLKEPVEAKAYTLDQWLFIEAERKRNMADGMDRKSALATAEREIKRYVRDIEEQRIKSKAPKHLIEFKTQGRSAWDKIMPDRWDEDESAGPPTPHHIGLTPIQSPPISDSGPYAENKSSSWETDDRPTVADDAEKQSSGPVKSDEKPVAAQPKDAPPIEAGLQVTRRDSGKPSVRKAKQKSPEEDEDDKPYSVRTKEL